ncbi:uracil-DNA glycosylase [bacterium]|nr:uracil-DNA glycosylase [bacterium]
MPRLVPPSELLRGDGNAKTRLLEEFYHSIKDCQKCPLGATRTHFVFGVGDADAELVFVGEAPGYDEDMQGEPFVGKAGQLLTRIIAAMGLSRRDVYICNVLKCRPPENRNPHPDEVALCSPYLHRQLEIIAPKVVVGLGKFGCETLLGRTVAITRERGRWQQYRGIPVMPTYHPSYLLRNPDAKREVWEDMKEVMRRLGIKSRQFDPGRE